MAYCSNCGAKAEGNFCSECGGRLSGKEKTEKPSGTENTAAQTPDFSDNIFGFDLSGLSKSVSDALAMQKEYEKTGAVSPDMLSKLQSGFGVNKIASDAQNRLAALEKSAKDEKARLKKARADIGKGVCPSCGEKFKKRQSSCKNCGESVLTESYEEY